MMQQVTTKETIVHLAKRGYTNKEIALSLNLDRKYVANCAVGARAKLDITAADEALMIELYPDLTIAAIAKKFCVDSPYVKALLVKNNIPIRRKKHEFVSEMLIKFPNYSVEKVALLNDCAVKTVQNIKIKMGLSPKKAPPLSDKSFDEVLAVDLLKSQGMTLKSACEAVGITVNAYYPRKRIMSGGK